MFEVLPDAMTPTNATGRMCVIVKGTGKSAAAQTSSDDASNVPPLLPLLWMIMLKSLSSLPIVHPYDIVEHGRRYYRASIYI